MVQTVQHIIVIPQFLVCKVIDVPVVQVERVPSAVVEETAVLRCVDRFMRHEACSRLGSCAQAQGQGLPPAIRAGRGRRGRWESDSQVICHPN